MSSTFDSVEPVRSPCPVSPLSWFSGINNENADFIEVCRQAAAVKKQAERAQGFRIQEAQRFPIKDWSEEAYQKDKKGYAVVKHFVLQLTRLSAYRGWSHPCLAGPLSSTATS